MRIMIKWPIASLLSNCHWLVPVYLLFCSHRDRKMCSCIVSSPTDILSTWHFTEMDNHRKGSSRKRWKCSKEIKYYNAGGEIWMKVNRIIDDTYSVLGMLLLLPFERLCICSQRNLVKMKLSAKRGRKVVVTKKDKDVPEEMMPRKYSY